MSKPEIQQAVSDFLTGASGQRSVVVEVTSPVDEDAQMRTDIIDGLSQPGRKRIPSLYLYSEKGSALFAEITALPEYYPTRHEAALLKTMVRDTPGLFENILFSPEIPENATQSSLRDCQIIELGSGNAAKTRILLDGWFASEAAKTCQLTYIPVDVSEAMLIKTVEALSQEYPALHILGLAGTYENALAALPPHSSRLVLFLGGTIGNFDTEVVQTEFFTTLHQLMGPQARLLVAYDQRPNEHKWQAVIERAYNDSQGLVASFTQNLLFHVNDRLKTDFSPSDWRHIAIYNETDHQIEMLLESTKLQEVHLPGFAGSFVFQSGEFILTLVSRKFDPPGLMARFIRSGYTTQAQWTDAEDYVGILLLEA